MTNRTPLNKILADALNSAKAEPKKAGIKPLAPQLSSAPEPSRRLLPQ